MAETAPEAPRMSPEELKSRLGDEDLIVLDVRNDKAWNEAKARIKGAVREDPNQVLAWYKRYPRDKTIVAYCA